MFLSSKLLIFFLAKAALASRPFLNEPDTGLQDFLGPDFPVGKLPNVTDLWSTHDFDWSARNYLSKVAYNWLRYATGAEYTYRNNMEDFPRVGFKPRVLSGATGRGINMSMETTILGYNFSAPFFISPAAAPELLVGPTVPEKELGLLKGAHTGGILYIPSIAADVTIEQFAAAKANTSQVIFQQLYAQVNMSYNQDIMTRTKAAGSKAIVWTVDTAADGAWVRGARFTIPPRNTVYPFTWEFFHQLRNLTDLPIVLKGITNVEDAKRAAKEGADAIFLSNHGGRHLDTSPTSLQVALAIHDEAPEIFQQIEVYADGGVRYGSDILKLMALGVRAVGLGRSFMYANLCYGQSGMERTIDLLKQEVYLDAVNLGITDLKELNSSWLDLDFLRSYQWDQW